MSIKVGCEGAICLRQATPTHIFWVGCDRLSDIEKQIIYSIAEENEAVAISQILSHLQLPASELINAMQSLGRRSLITKITQSNETLFNLQPMVKQYVKVGFNET